MNLAAALALALVEYHNASADLRDRPDSKAALHAAVSFENAVLACQIAPHNRERAVEIINAGLLSVRRQPDWDRLSLILTAVSA